jgi:LPS export ABC transporter protein LptC
VAVAALLVSLSGCVSQARKPQPPEPFVFRSLNLRQQSADGQPAWEILSPEASYDITSKVAQARNLRGTVFRAGQPHILVNARNAKVVDDGQRLELQHGVVITLLGVNPVQISGDRAVWLPRQNVMLIDRHPVATDRRSRIRARTARYLLADDRVELRGGTVLEQWQQPPLGKGPRPPAPLRVSTTGIDWKPEQGRLLAAGAVQGQRWSTPGPVADLQLTATGLQGNLRQGVVDLLAPVRLRNREGNGWLAAGQTRWAIHDQWLASDQPFRGALRQLSGQGQALRINLAASTVLVPSGCELQQPGEQLRAQRCLWHWPSGRVLADGGVELRRQTYQQITRASVLHGRIGSDGLAVFTAPGSRVTSQFTLPQGAGQPGPQAAGPPVTF